MPGAVYELDDRSEEEEGAVEGDSHGLLVRTQQPVEHLEPLPHENID